MPRAAFTAAPIVCHALERSRALDVIGDEMSGQAAELLPENVVARHSPLRLTA
jgi:hypothetical protein